MLANGVTTITGAEGDAKAIQGDKRIKGAIFKNCAPFTECISKRNNTKVDNEKDFDVLMTMYNLMEYSNNYSKTPESLLQYDRDQQEICLTKSELFKLNIKITGETLATGKAKDVKIAVLLKYLSNFWRTFGMPLINVFHSCANKFAITDTKLYIPVVTLSIQENTKLYLQLESSFKRAINWNKYHSNTTR